MPYRDEFDDPNMDKNIASTLDAVRREVFLRTRGPAVAAGVLLIAAIVLAAVIFFTYPGSDDADTVPVIQADARPFKVIPEDPGGMEIPHRDSTVFSSLRNSTTADEIRVENLFDDEETEEPMPRSQLFAGLNTEDEMNEIDPAAGTEELLDEGVSGEKEMFGDMKEKSSGEFSATRPTVEDSMEKAANAAAEDLMAEEESFEKVELIQPKEEAADAAPAVTSTTVAPTPSIVAKKAEPVKEAAPVMEARLEMKPEPKPAPKPEQKLAALKETPKTDMVTGQADGTHYVQIGAVKSAAAAETGWGAYQKEYSPVLSGMDHRIQRADLGEKGIYFRIQAGPLSKSQADSVCSQIKAQKPGGCIIVAR